MVKKNKYIILIITSGLLCGLAYYLFIYNVNVSSYSNKVSCINSSSTDGQLIKYKFNPKNIFGLGLSYKQHIKETASEFDPEKAPPVFMKHIKSLNASSNIVNLPTKEELLYAIAYAEQNLDKLIEKEFNDFPVLLDYEVELGIVVLENIMLKRLNESSYMPKIGYFLANDLSSRSIAVLGEGKKNKTDYWGISKSFEGFLPVSEMIWIPKYNKPNTMFCTVLKTTVNGKVKQNQSTKELIYSPKQIIKFILQKYPEFNLEKGDLILTGTPGGVALKIPLWKKRFGNLIGFDRIKKLDSIINLSKNELNFLKINDVVSVESDVFGKVKGLLLA